MTAEQTTCGRTACDRPADGWYLCQPCTHDLEKQLHDTAWMLDQLDLVIAGGTRYTDHPGKTTSRDTETRLPYSPHAATVRDNYTAAITGTALATYANNPAYVDEWPTSGPITPTFAAAWLATRISALRLHPDAGPLADAITKAHETALYTIDRPPGRKYLGTCATDWQGLDCGGRIYQRAGKPEARCDTCGGEYTNVEALEAAILERLDSHLATAPEIAELATYLDLTINRTQVRKAINLWVHRKQLVPAQREPDIKFRFIEARVLLEKAEEKRRKVLQ